MWSAEKNDLTHRGNHNIPPAKWLTSPRQPLFRRLMTQANYWHHLCNLQHESLLRSSETPLHFTIVDNSSLDRHSLITKRFVFFNRHLGCKVCTHACQCHFHPPLIPCFTWHTALIERSHICYVHWACDKHEHTLSPDIHRSCNHSAQNNVRPEFLAVTSTLDALKRKKIRHVVARPAWNGLYWSLSGCTGLWCGPGWSTAPVRLVQISFFE